MKLESMDGNEPLVKLLDSVIQLLDLIYLYLIHLSL